MTVQGMRFLLLPALILISACANVPETSVAVPANSNSLSARTLAPNECGLFVWTADVDKRFKLFSQSQTGSGIWNGPNGETAISLTEKSGAPTDGQYPKQSFEGAGLTLVLRDAEGITQGTRYKEGTLTQLSPEGWDKVTPVVGLSMCQTG